MTFFPYIIVITNVESGNYYIALSSIYEFNNLLDSLVFVFVKYV